jgi:hypothetical protein
MWCVAECDEFCDGVHLAYIVKENSVCLIQSPISWCEECVAMLYSCHMFHNTNQFSVGVHVAFIFKDNCV